jgi:hypothetical protein
MLAAFWSSYGKQSAGFSSALAMGFTLRNNIAYNLPRSGFNLNDHFGGSNNITNNLICAYTRTPQRS